MLPYAVFQAAGKCQHMGIRQHKGIIFYINIGKMSTKGVNTREFELSFDRYTILEYLKRAAV